MNKNVRNLAIAALLVALAVAGAGFSIPVGIAKCSPVQHLVNVLSAVMLGPLYAVEVAFTASLIRVLMGTGTLLAFPGSICGALLAALIFRRSKKLLPACIGEVIGTGIIGALFAYPVAVLLMNKTAAIFGFVIPFAVSSAGGAVIAYVLLRSMKAFLKEKGIFND